MNKENILSYNNKEMKQTNKEKMKVTYAYSYDNVWYDLLIENLRSLFDIKWADFIWKHFNDSYVNVLKGYVREYEEMDVYLSETGFMKEVYNDFIENIKDEMYTKEEIENETDKEKKEKMKMENKRYRRYIKEIKFRKFKEAFKDVYVFVDLLDFSSSRYEIWVYEDDIYDYLKWMWIIEENDLYFIRDLITYSIKMNSSGNISEKIFNKYDMIEVEATGYWQGDYDKYIIYINKKDIKKIEKQTGLKYEDWKAEVEFNLKNLLTVYSINIYIENEEWEKEFLISMTLYWDEGNEEIKENIKEEVKNFMPDVDIDNISIEEEGD